MEGRRASNSMSGFFMADLDELTSAVYPQEPLVMLQEGEKASRFNTKSWACLSPVLVAIARLTIHVLLPYITICIFIAAAIGLWRDVCVAFGCCLLAYLCLFDPAFWEMFTGRHQLLQPGLRCRQTRRSQAIISMVPALQYPHYKGTPWILNGDMATIYPFIAFKLPRVEYDRRWLSVNTKHLRGAEIPKVNPFRDSDTVSKNRRVASNVVDVKLREDTNGNANRAQEIIQPENGSAKGKAADDCRSSVEEAVALDLALPESGMDPAKPFYLVLHGLNGGSSEAYVLDFAAEALKRECGVCVMVSRGCMGTPVRGSEIFHGARTSDVADTVRTLRLALPAETPLCLVGYSMGAIIAANYVAISGENSGVTCCVSMSGSFDTRTNMTSQHSLRLWQPMLALNLKENFVSNNTGKLAARGIKLAQVEMCRDVLAFDTQMVAPYNGYASVTDYYIDMSAGAENKILGLKTPLLAVSALDDPIMTAAGSPIDAEEVKDLYILLTRSGGHVGWATGWLPTRNKWSWMSSTSLDFCEAVVATASLAGS